jgi:hypothetical protein
MNLSDFSECKIFFALQPDLNVPVALALKALNAEWAYEDAEDMYDDVREKVHEGSLLTGLPAEEHRRLCQWMDRAPVREFIAAISQTFWARRAAQAPRPATEGQLRIITEAQPDVGVDFTPFFSQLTSWQADAIIKGLIAISEIQRCTHSRQFSPRDLRAAIRSYITPGAVLPRHPEKRSLTSR